VPAVATDFTTVVDEVTGQLRSANCNVMTRMPRTAAVPCVPETVDRRGINGGRSSSIHGMYETLLLRGGVMFCIHKF